MAHAELYAMMPDRIVVTTVFNEKELIKQVPGARWNATQKEWTVPLTWTSCIVLRGVFGESLKVGEKLQEWAWPVTWEMAVRRQMRERLEPEARLDPRLYPFQEAGVEFLQRTQETLLADEMGTGKTVQAVMAVQEWPVLVICPNSVKRSWKQHFEQWRPGHPVFVVEGSAAQRDKVIAKAKASPECVVVINYDSMRTMSRLAPYGSEALRRCRTCDPKSGEEGLIASRCQVHPKALNTIDFRTVIVDEAHKVKSPKAQQTRAVWAAAHQPSVRYRWALTGTPIANHPGDLWSILHLISPRDFPTRTHYVDRYCLQSWNAMGGLDIVGLNPGMRDEFFSLLDPRFRRVRKHEVLKFLPPKVRSTRWVEMAPKQRRMYDDFEDSLVVIDDEGHEMVAPNALISALRRMQLSSATIEVSSWRPHPDMDEGYEPLIRMTEPSTKLDALEDILEELDDKPVAVCAFHRQLIDLAAARLQRAGISHGLITGGQTPYDRDKALRDFQEGRIRVLLFTISAGGTGLTMTAADTLVFLQRSWSMVDNRQAEDRIHRIGAEVHESVNIVDIVTRGSLEEDQIMSLTEKLMRLDEITRDREAGGDLTTLDFEEEVIMRTRLL